MEKGNDFIMLPTVDFCFKELMQDDKVREGFVAALLNVPPEEVRETTLLPTIMEGEFPDDKLVILDVRVKLLGGMQMDMEMQVLYASGWENRTLYYLGKMYVGQLKKGEDYTVLNRCCLVCILDFNLFADDRCYRTISMRDDETNDQYSNLMEIQILELQKLQKEHPESGSVYDWMRFLRGKTKEEFEEMAAEYEYFDVAYQKMVKLSADEVKKLEYETREKNLRDFRAVVAGGVEQGMEQGIKQGMEQGIKQGMEQGIEQEKKNLIRLKLAKNRSVEQIADELEETPERIKELIDQMDSNDYLMER